MAKNEKATSDEAGKNDNEAQSESVKCPASDRFEISTKYGSQRSVTFSWANCRILEKCASGRNLGPYVNAAIQEYTLRHYKDDVPATWLESSSAKVGDFMSCHKKLLVLLGIPLIGREILKKMLTILEQDGIQPDQINDQNLHSLCEKYAKRHKIYDCKECYTYWIIPLYIIKSKLSLDTLLDCPSYVPKDDPAK